MRKSFIYIFIIAAFLLSGCQTKEYVVIYPQQREMINLALLNDEQNIKYLETGYGISLNVIDGRTNQDILRKYDATATIKPEVGVEPSVHSFVNESMKRYMKNMGFNIDSDVNTDYMMQLTITEFGISYLSGSGWTGTVKMNVEVYDQNRTLVYPNVPISGRVSKFGNSNDWELATMTMNSAYNNALEDIDWDRIAFFLNGANSGKGSKANDNSALESSVIRWYITSSPQGADVYWRVVSSAAEVKNTNLNFLGTTPYESTETMDIKGLTANNLGNVQIEITCEKNGFIVQKKRFNLEQVIDQKEISTKFNLVKEE